VITDPTFGTQILRVSDAKTLTNAANASFQTPVAVPMNNWNADGTMFWVSANGVTVPFKFDPVAMKATRIAKAGDPSGGLTLSFSGPFSFLRPNIMYGTVGRTAVEYDFNTNTSKVVFNGNVAAPISTGSALTPSASDDDTKLCMGFGGTATNVRYVAVLDRASGIYTVLDMNSSLIQGKASNMKMGFGASSAVIDRTGRYVSIRNAGVAATAPQWTIWDVTGGTVYAATVQMAGNEALGFASRVNQSGYSGSFSDQIEWSSRSLTASNVNNATYAINPASLPSPHQSIYNGSVSWNNAQSNTMVPLVGAIARDSLQGSLPWRAWDDEIVAAATDGSGTVWRFAHHRNLWASNTTNLPLGNVSQNGGFFVFTSNWDNALGTDPSGKKRTDVFIVRLGRSSTAPTVSITSPAASANVTGTVTVQAAASDASGIAGVQFKLDGANLGA
jgi:hypothetical protein